MDNLNRRFSTMETLSTTKVPRPLGPSSSPYCHPSTYTLPVYVFHHYKISSTQYFLSPFLTPSTFFSYPIVKIIPSYQTWLNFRLPSSSPSSTFPLSLHYPRLQTPSPSLNFVSSWSLWTNQYPWIIVTITGHDCVCALGKMRRGSIEGLCKGVQIFYSETVRSVKGLSTEGGLRLVVLSIKKK